MMATRSGLVFVQEGQAQVDIPLNADIELLDVLTNAVIVNRTTATPPGSPVNGDCYIVAASPTGVWVGHTGHVAYYFDGWWFAVAYNGMKVYDNNTKQWLQYFSSSTKWIVLDGAYVTSSFSATPSFDLKDANKFQMILTANITSVTIAGGYFDGQLLYLRFKQDGTGSRTLSGTSFGFGSTYGSITLSTGVNLTDLIVLEWNTGLGKWCVINVVKGIS